MDRFIASNKRFIDTGRVSGNKMRVQEAHGKLFVGYYTTPQTNTAWTLNDEKLCYVSKYCEPFLDRLENLAQIKGVELKRFENRLRDPENGREVAFWAWDHVTEYDDSELIANNRNHVAVDEEYDPISGFEPEEIRLGPNRYAFTQEFEAMLERQRTVMQNAGFSEGYVTFGSASDTVDASDTTEPVFAAQYYEIATEGAVRPREATTSNRVETVDDLPF